MQTLNLNTFLWILSSFNKVIVNANKLHDNKALNILIFLGLISLNTVLCIFDANLKYIESINNKIINEIMNFIIIFLKLILSSMKFNFILLL